MGPLSVINLKEGSNNIHSQIFNFMYVCICTYMYHKQSNMKYPNGSTNHIINIIHSYIIYICAALRCSYLQVTKLVGRLLQMSLLITIINSARQGCGNFEPTAGHFDNFSSLLSCSQYTLYIVQFQFTRHSLDLSDNVLHDWLFPHHWC